MGRPGPDDRTIAEGPSAVGPLDRIRDHLANERTFLAWVRSAIALLGLGFVLARMGLFLRRFAALGGADVRLGAHAGNEFLITGIIFLVFGTILGAGSGWHYDRVRRGIELGQFGPSRGMVLALTAVIAAGGLVIVALVLWRTIELEGGR